MNKLFEKNQGLTSRFPIRINFPDYNPDDLLEVAERMAAAKSASLSADARELLCGDLLSKPVQGNARHVRNLIEGAERRRDTRITTISDPTRADLTTLMAADFNRL